MTTDRTTIQSQLHDTMYHINQIPSLDDGAPIDQIEFTLLSLGDERKGKEPGWASSWIGKAVDGNSNASVTFSFKKQNPAGWVGKRLLLTAGRDKEGRPSGIKVKANGQYKNLWVTDSAKIQVPVEDTAYASNPYKTPAPAVRSASSAPPPVDPETYAKHLATEWCTVYDWASPIFETRLDKTQVKECVTGIVIEMRRHGIKILDLAKEQWRNVEFKGEKLGSWDEKRIKSAIIKVWQGAKVTDAVREALTAASNEPEFSVEEIFAHLLASEGITDMQAVDTVLIQDFKSRVIMSREEYIAIIGNPGFITAVKQFIAAASAVTDSQDEDAIEL